MNLILLFEEDFIGDQRVRLCERRREHVQNVHRAELGDQLTVGLLNGSMGTGEVVVNEGDTLELQVNLHQLPPPGLPLTLLLALPRPKMLKRILQTVTAMGVKKLVLLNSYRVEKSYWQTPILHEENLRQQLVLGLEQAKDTRLPEVILRKRFKPFVEDELPAMMANSRALVAHPNTNKACPRQVDSATTLAIGPEGGFIEYEIEKLAEVGFEAVHLGPRILRVENAVPAILGRLF
jgi:RsmE family RNA methyltransferase